MSNAESNSRKEEILAKSRNSSSVWNDEGVQHAIDKGNKLGSLFAITVVCFPLLILMKWAGEMIAVYSLALVYCAFCFGEFLGKYRFLKQKRYLITSIIHLAIGLAAAFFLLTKLRGSRVVERVFTFSTNELHELLIGH